MDLSTAEDRTPSKVARSGCCSITLYILFGLLVGVGNLLSYTPFTDELNSDFKNETLMKAWTSGVISPPWNAEALMYSGFFQLMAFFMLPFVAVAVHRSLDKEMKTWYDSYMDTPGQRLSMVLLYVCLWGFVGHVVQLFASDDCDVCTGPAGKTWPQQGSEVLAKLYPSAFWLHAGPAAVISLLAPFQFTVKIRKWNSFYAHRWIGRAVLVASCVHQSSATYLTVCNLFVSRHNSFPTSWAANTVYALGFVPFNIYSWTATILGWKCARQGRIVEHGAWMYRLASMWVITVIVFRGFSPVMGVLFGPEWGLALHVPLAFLWTIPLEIFIRKSGRFDWSKVGKDVQGKECPFSGTLERGNANSVNCPLLGAQ